MNFYFSRKNPWNPWNHQNLGNQSNFTWFNWSRPFSIIQAFTVLWAIKNKEMATFLGWSSKLEKIRENPQLRHDISFLSIIIVKFKEFHFNSKTTAISLFFIAQSAVKAKIIDNCLGQLKEVDRYISVHNHLITTIIRL